LFPRPLIKNQFSDDKKINMNKDQIIPSVVIVFVLMSNTRFKELLTSSTDFKKLLIIVGT
jgi:hypothetical protein